MNDGKDITFMLLENVFRELFRQKKEFLKQSGYEPTELYDEIRRRVSSNPWRHAVLKYVSDKRPGKDELDRIIEIAAKLETIPEFKPDMLYRFPLHELDPKRLEGFLADIERARRRELDFIDLGTYDKYRFVVPKDYITAYVLGNRTNWCVAKNLTYFNEYVGNGFVNGIVVFIYRNGRLVAAYAKRFDEEDELVDVENNPISWENLHGLTQEIVNRMLTKSPEIPEHVKSHIKNEIKRKIDFCVRITKFINGVRLKPELFEKYPKLVDILKKYRSHCPWEDIENLYNMVVFQLITGGLERMTERDRMFLNVIPQEELVKFAKLLPKKSKVHAYVKKMTVNEARHERSMNQFIQAIYYFLKYVFPCEYRNLSARQLRERLRELFGGNEFEIIKAYGKLFGYDFDERLIRFVNCDVTFYNWNRKLVFIDRKNMMVYFVNPDGLPFEVHIYDPIANRMKTTKKHSVLFDHLGRYLTKLSTNEFFELINSIRKAGFTEFTNIMENHGELVLEKLYRYTGKLFDINDVALEKLIRELEKHHADDARLKFMKNIYERKIKSYDISKRIAEKYFDNEEMVEDFFDAVLIGNEKYNYSVFVRKYGDREELHRRVCAFFLDLSKNPRVAKNFNVKKALENVFITTEGKKVFELCPVLRKIVGL